MNVEPSALTIFTAARAIITAMRGRDLGLLEGVDATLAENFRTVMIYTWFSKGALDPVCYELPSIIDEADFDAHAVSETFKAVLLSVNAR